MSTVDPEILSLNPFEPGYFADPYAQYASVREASPVHQSLLGPWMLFGHDDVLRVLRDPTLSVEEHNVAANPLLEAQREQFGDLADERMEQRTRSMLDLDPPDHDRLRRLVAKAFNPAMIRSLIPRIEVLVDEALDGMVAHGDAADVITDLAFPLPFTVISEMLGMPEGNRDRLRDWSHAMVKTLDPIITEAEARAAFDSAGHMIEHVFAAIEWKRREPSDDLLTKLIVAEDEGDMLTEDELVAQVVLLYIAGHETTVNLIGNATFALLRHPDQTERLRSDPALEENAIEELLRFDSPVQFSRRITLAPLPVCDVMIEPGVFVLTCLGSANRDLEFWGPTANTLDLGREGAAQHVSFGSGVHHCLGAALARVEARAAIPTLVRRFPALALADPDAEPAWNGRIVLRGLDRLPVALG
ncbi:MAG: cytochrome P450 [Acidimicrobiia bacterium]